MSGTVGGMSTLFLSSPLKLEEEAKRIEKQGIVSILGSDTVQQHTKAPASLRRTLSADMSSKKWLTQHGLIISPMKKIGSSQQIAVADSLLSSSEEEEEKEEFERPGGQARVWRRSIQSKSQKEEEEELGKSGQVDIWSQILSQKANEDKSMLPPPYIHPLVKRSASSLSSKSLEVCTESLGSETGSDGFSSYASSETGDIEEDKVQEEEEEVQQQSQQQQQEEEKESQYSFEREELGLGVAKYNNFYSTTTSTSKKLSSFNSSFPPPLPSLARGDGPSLHVQSYRENGRLVLEAVSTPSNNNFHAHRQDGRLILKFVTVGPSEEEIIDQQQQQQDQEEDEAEEIEQNFEEEEKYYEAEEEDEEITQVDESEDDEVIVVVKEKVNENKNEAKANKEEIGIVMEQQAPKLSSGAINVHRSALMMKKLMGLDNRNPTWTTKKFNQAVNLVEMEEEESPTLTPLAQSLPRPPRVAHLIPSPPATAASFNAYEYFWRTKPTVATLINNQQCRPPLKNNCNKVFLSSGSTTKSHEQQEMVLLGRNKEDNLVPLFRGCKETRRSLLIWEPCTIASS